MSKHQRLKDARVRAGFKTAAEAARHLRVPYGTYSGHESGSRGIKDKELQHYADAFSVAVSWLAYDKEVPAPGSTGFELSFAIGNVGKSPDGAVEWAETDKNARRITLEHSTAFDSRTGKIDKDFSLPDFNYAAPALSLAGQRLSSIIVRGNHVQSIAKAGSALYFIKEYHDFTDNDLLLPALIGLSEGIFYIGIPTSVPNKKDIHIIGATQPFTALASNLTVSPIVAIVTPHGRGAALRAMGTRLIESALAVSAVKK